MTQPSLSSRGAGRGGWLAKGRWGGGGWPRLERSGQTRPSRGGFNVDDIVGQRFH